jgi:RNA polymerase sigma factor (sigma-70 family)
VIDAHVLGTAAAPVTGLGYSRSRTTMSELTRERTLTRDATLASLRLRILSAARRRLSAADAEDLTQEVLLLLTTKYAEVEDPAQLVALGLGILRKKRADLWRKSSRQGEASAEDATVLPLAHGGPLPDTVAADRERLRLFAEAAARLEGRCREILRRKLEGLSFVEIAAELGRPVNTVYSWDFRCHQRLRTLLGDRWGFVAGGEGR